ncbi:MAG: lamin tail domain-containing protein [Treponema sp.]|nr:lamin tail domain-containing protein [Treponema sp.]
MKITFMAVIAILFCALLIMGCPDGDEDNKKNKEPGEEPGKNPGEDPDPGNNVKVQGKVIILQAYGNAGSADSPAGVSHSFVELYNISDEDIDLSGVNLYFANGIRGNDVTEDEAWKSIALTRTIPAKGSFLILGKEHDDLTGTRYKITNGYGDINDDNLSLNRRGFKVAIIKSTTALTVQNPFNNGKPVSGYIDMVGAVNNPGASQPDNIFGFEEAPARCSASEAVRRKDLIDYDDNSTDFTAARYASTGEGAFTNEMLEVRKPRNSSAGEWDPFAPPAPPPEPPDNVDYTKLKLNEVSGVGADSEKFYELINTGDIDIPLYECKIYYNANGSTGGTLPTGKGNLTWTGSTSQAIEAGKLFGLIGRNTPGSFSTGLTAGRILIITLEDPAGNEIDRCVRAKDTGDFAFTDKSFSRIPDGTGDFYFTTPTPDETNGASTDGLVKVPDNQ